jgi:phospholipid N-methyltransferase
VTKKILEKLQKDSRLIAIEQHPACIEKLHALSQEDNFEVRNMSACELTSTIPEESIDVIISTLPL